MNSNNEPLWLLGVLYQMASKQQSKTTTVYVLANNPVFRAGLTAQFYLPGWWLQVNN